MSDVDCPVLTILHGGYMWLLALREFLQLVPACAHVLSGHLAHGLPQNDGIYCMVLRILRAHTVQRFLFEAKRRRLRLGRPVLTS